MSEKAKTKPGELSARVLKADKIIDAFTSLGSKAVKSSSGAVLKFHFKALDSNDIQVMANLNKKHGCGLNILRSGTGLTVLVFL